MRTGENNVEAWASPRVLARGDGIVVGEFGPTCVAVWRKDSTLERFSVQKHALVDFVARNAGRAAFCCVVEPSSGTPNEEGRIAAGRMVETLGKDLRAVAMVIEGTGFRSALVRSVAAGIVMVMGKRSVPVSYVATTEEGATWLKRYVHIDSTAAFVAAIEVFRSSLD